MAADLRRVADLATTENNQFRTELRASSLEMSTFRAEIADQQRQTTAHASQAANACDA
jgi:hypothetical protein